MQTKPTLAEGKDSELTTDKSASRGAACSACGGSGLGPAMYRPEIDRTQRDLCFICKGTGGKTPSKYTEPHGSKERVEEQLRIALDGHSESELWGENGLIAATMRCVEAVSKIEDLVTTDHESKEAFIQRVRGIISLPNVDVMASLPRASADTQTKH